MLLLFVLLLAAWAVRIRGIEWPLLHPDEYKITAWASWMEEHTRTLNPAYPGGFFHLVKPVLLIKNAMLDGVSMWQSFIGHDDSAIRTAVDETFLLRKINVAFALLTVWLFYAMTFRITKSRMGALAAAAFLGLSALHVEHSHYAETDIAMLLTFTLALYAWIRVSDSGRIRWVCAAALLTGLAVGTKYTNLLLLPSALAALIVGWWRADRRGGYRLAGLIGLALVLILVGWLYTNRHVLDGAEYWKAVQAAGRSTYSERNGLLGQALGDPRAVLISNWNTLALNLKDINPVWLLMALAGALVSIQAAYRRYWGLIWLPVIFYLLYCFKLAPWVRDQECFLFFPFLAFFIAIGVHEGIQRASSVKGRRWLLTGLAFGLVAACLESGLDALRCSSLFLMPEARIQAMKWLYGHAPLDKMVGIEEYTVPTCRLFADAVSVPQIEKMTPGQHRQSPMQYLLRNVSSTGRGTVDPRTRKLYPNYADNLAEFTKEGRRLCHWGASEPRFTFAGHEIEWWDARPLSPLVEMTSPIFRPLWVFRLPCLASGMSQPGVGCAEGLLVDSQWQHMVMGGSSHKRRNLFVILQTQERGADIIVDGMGDHRSVHLDPYQVRVVTVRRPWYVPRLSEYDMIAVKSKPHAHVRYLPCYAQVVDNPNEVAMILFQKGYPDEALGWLTSIPDVPNQEWLRYCCAVEAEDWELASKLEGAARRCLEMFEKARETTPDRLLLNGCTGSAWQDHSRIRLPVPDTGVNGLDFKLLPLSLNLSKDDESAHEFTGRLELPVRLSPGLYTIRATVAIPMMPAVDSAWSVMVGEDLQESKPREPVLVEPGHPREIVCRVKVNREQDVALDFSSGQRGGRLDVTGIEIRWNEGSLLWAERRALYEALIRHAWHHGDTEAAKALVAKARESVPGAARWGRLQENKPVELGLTGQGTRIFYPWFKLMSAEPVGSQCRVTLKALKDDPPNLKLMAFKKAFSGPRKYFEAALPINRRVIKGDDVVMDIPMPAKLQTSDISLRLLADEPWVSTPLRVEGTTDGRLWLGK